MLILLNCYMNECLGFAGLYLWLWVEKVSGQSRSKAVPLIYFGGTVKRIGVTFSFVVVEIKMNLPLCGY